MDAPRPFVLGGGAYLVVVAEIQLDIFRLIYLLNFI